MSSARPRARLERSAGGVVVRTLEGRPHVLLIRDPYKNWGLPKGHLEDGETAREAAEREVREETGLEGLEVGDEVTTIDWYFRRGGRLIHKYCTFFLMRSASGEAVPQEAEGITECAWVTLDEACSWIVYENAREVVEEVQRRLEAAS